MLEFLDAQLVHVPSSYSWISTKRFRIRGGADDAAMLAALIAHVQYADTYAGGTVDESEPPLPIHGPYERAAISSSSFEPSSCPAARERLIAWATERAIKGWPADSDDLERFLADDLPSALLAVNASVYELPDLRETAEHEWGWVVGQLGFLEFVVIDRPSATLSLVVASDD